MFGSNSGGFGGGLFGNSSTNSNNNGLFGTSNASNTANQPNAMGNSATGTSFGSAPSSNMFGSAPSSTPFGGASSKNSTAPASGFSFGGANSQNNANGSALNQGSTFGSGAAPSSNLFGNSANKPNGGLFGSSPAAPSSTVNNAFGSGNTNSGGGGLFGGSGSTGGGLFDKPSAPSGSLFGGSSNSAQNGTFGNNSNTQNSSAFGQNTQNQTGSLFGQKPQTGGAPNLQNQSGGLFGANNQNQPGGLFGSNNQSQQSGGMFGGAGAQKPSGGLFGSSSNQTSTLGSSQPSLLGTTQPPSTGDQYGVKLGPLNVGDMPKSLTESLNRSKTEPSRKRSNSLKSLQRKNSQQFVSHMPSTASFLGFGGSENIKGIFSNVKAENKDENMKDGKEIKSVNGGMKKTHISEIRKLVINRKPSEKRANFDLIDANQVITKRRRILGSADLTLLPTSREAFEVNGKVEHEKKVNQLGYWCSPSIPQLSRMSDEKLTAVQDFIIGRVGYGQVSYEFPVDLTQFKSNFEELLFGKVVVFSHKLVMVYHEECKKPPVGNGINVPATVTLDKCFPTEKGTKVPIVDPSRPEVQQHFKLLKMMPGMRFVSYDPIVGTWVFHVDHFSIWGLIDDDDDEVDPEIASEFQRQLEQEAEKEAAKQAKSQLVHAAVEEMSDDESIEMFDAIQGDDLVIVANSPASSEGDFEVIPDSIVHVRPFEPNVEDIDMEVIDTKPNFETSNEWLMQLKLDAFAGSAFDENVDFALNPETVSSRNLDKKLFNDLDKEIDAQREMQRALRWSPHAICSWASDNRVVCKGSDHPTLSVVEMKSQLPKISTALETLHSKSSLEKRENGFPLATSKSTRFRDLLEVGYVDELWDLCWRLFDKDVLESERRSLVVAWLKSTTLPEISQLLSDSHDDLLECCFLCVVAGNVLKAAEFAIKSGNEHLAVVISLLGSKDPSLKVFAKGQLEEWNRQQESVPMSLHKILTVVAGDLTEELFEGLSWRLRLALQLEYGLEEPFGESLEVLDVSDDVAFNILRLYAGLGTMNDVLVQMERIEFQWVLCEVLVRSNKEARFEGWEQELDSITIKFYEYLLMNQLWKEAIFVLSHLNNDELATKHISHLISIKIDYFSKLGENLVSVLGIPHSVVHKAIALRYRYSGDYWNEAESLLDASAWAEAHEVLVKHVAPIAVIEQGEDLQKLSKLLSRLEGKGYISQWDTEGAVYQQYLTVLELQDIPLSDPRFSGKLLPSLKYLLEQLKNVKVTSFNIKVAVHLMARLVVMLLLDRFTEEETGIRADRLLSLPLSENELNYFKKRVPSHEFRQKLLGK